MRRTCRIGVWFLIWWKL